MMKSRRVTVCGLVAVFLFVLTALSFTACEQPASHGITTKPPAEDPPEPGVPTVTLPTANVTTLAAHEWADGAIAEADGEQWFKFTATHDTKYIHFEPGELGYVQIHLYDSAGAEVGSGSHASYAPHKSHSVTVGEEYYIRVTPADWTYTSGAYRIGFTTSFLSPGTFITTLTADEWANGAITSGSEQWFKFTATADTQYIRFEPGTLNNVNMQLYTSDGKTPQEQANLNSNTRFASRSQSIVAGNEYYIKITPYTSGDGGEYQIRFTEWFLTPGKTVTTLDYNTWADGVIAEDGEQWFRFITMSSDSNQSTMAHYIHFEPDTLTSVNVQVYTSGGMHYGVNQPNLNDTTRYVSRTLTKEAEYYIKITPHSSDDVGGYRIAFSTLFVPPEIWHITDLDVDTWADGSDAVNSEQWFKFTAASTSSIQSPVTHYIHFDPGTLNSVNVQLYTSVGALSADQITLNASTRTAPRQVITGSVYYIRVMPSADGGGAADGGEYRIAFSPVSASPDSLTVLALDLWMDGEIRTVGDEQWYKLYARSPTGTEYIHFERGTLAGVSVQPYLSTGVSTGSPAILNATTRYMDLKTPYPIYYIKVKPSEGGTRGTYRIGHTNSTAAPTLIPMPTDGIIMLTAADTWYSGALAADGEQWYKFTATADREYIHFERGTLSGVSALVYTNAGGVIGSTRALDNTTVNRNFNSVSGLTAGEEYYIKVTPGSNGSGTYWIAYAHSTSTFYTRILPTANVTALTPDEWANGSVIAYGEQWYKFTATAATQFIYFSPGTLASASMQLYAADTGRNFLAYTMDSSTTRIATSTSPLTIDSEYYIRIKPYVGGASGAYKVGFTASSLPPGVTTVIPLTANTWTEGNLVSGTDVQWFKFTATAASQYFHYKRGSLHSNFGVNIQLYASTSTSMWAVQRLYDESGANAYRSFSLTSGTEYYVKVTPYHTAEYGSFRIGFTDSTTPPQIITLPTAAVTALTVGEWGDGNTLSYNKEQWFKFTAGSNPQYIHFSPSGLTNAEVEVYTGAGLVVGKQSSMSSGAFSIASRTVTIGAEYYIKVRPSGTSGSSGTFRMGLTSSIAPPNTNITMIAANTWADGNLASGIVEQWYQFTATAATQYFHFNPGNLYRADLLLYTRDGTLVANRTVNTAPVSNIWYVSESVTVDSEYYIRVRRISSGGSADNGAYQLGITASNIPPAAAIAGNTWVQGVIAETVAGHSSDRWFKFTATSSTQYIHFEPGTLNNVNVELRDSTGASRGSINVSGSAPYATVSVTGGAEYYLRVTPNAGANSSYGGTFMIGISNSAATPQIITLPTAGVTTLTPNTWASGSIVNDGAQWFKFTATAAAQYIHFRSGTLGSVNVQLYSAAGTTGTIMGEPANLNNSALYASRSVTSGGVYYIKVTPGGGASGGEYQIGVTALLVPPAVPALTPGVYADGAISAAGEQWFKFTATEVNSVWFLPGTLKEVNVQLYDNAGVAKGSVAHLYGTPPHAGSRPTEIDLDGSSLRAYQSGLTVDSEYYIKVTPYSGDNSSGVYRIGMYASGGVKLIPPTTGVTTLAAAQTWYYGNITPNGEQWFKFTATAWNQYLHFKGMETLENVYFQLYDRYGNRVAARGPDGEYPGGVLSMDSSDGASSDWSSPILNLGTGDEYYIRVWARYWGESGSFKIAFGTVEYKPSN